ncbi:MAG: hypothetical protein IKR48_00990, partial [Kiritimatiellae bacterium]|nr:hypothetical protein [Kiritimatiellia bacterium]
HAKLEAEKALIAARGEWEEKLDEAVKIIPAFPEDAKNVDTHWQTVMDTLAEKNHISITRSQAPQVEQVGNLSEMVIECKDWEGTLKSIVNFLWSLHQEGASLDIRQLYIHPIQNRPGFLKGYFTLSCAYMYGEREEEDEDEEEKPVSATEKETMKPTATNAPPADTTNETHDSKQAPPTPAADPDTSANITNRRRVEDLAILELLEAASPDAVRDMRLPPHSSLDTYHWRHRPHRLTSLTSWRHLLPWPGYERDNV